MWDFINFHFSIFFQGEHHRLFGRKISHIVDYLFSIYHSIWSYTFMIFCQKEHNKTFLRKISHILLYRNITPCLWNPTIYFNGYHRHLLELKYTKKIAQFFNKKYCRIVFLSYPFINISQFFWRKNFANFFLGTKILLQKFLQTEWESAVLSLKMYKNIFLILSVYSEKRKYNRKIL